MAENPYKAAQLDFNYTRQDDKKIVFRKLGDDGLPIDNSGYLYKMEAHEAPDPASEVGQLFSLTGTAGGLDGKITFAPLPGDGGTFGGTLPDEIYYDVIETDPTPDTWTIIRGKITIDPRISDKGV